jgi:hypothetical protein
MAEADAPQPLARWADQVATGKSRTHLGCKGRVPWLPSRARRIAVSETTSPNNNRCPWCHLKSIGAWPKVAQASWRLCSPEIAALVIAITQACGDGVDVPSSARKAVTLAELVALCSVYKYAHRTIANLVRTLERSDAAAEEIRYAIRATMAKVNKVKLSAFTGASVDALLSVPWRGFDKSLLVRKPKNHANKCSADATARPAADVNVATATATATPTGIRGTW